MIRLTLLAFVLMIGLGGCKPITPSKNSNSADNNGSVKPQPAKPKGFQPHYTLKIETLPTEPATNVVKWTAFVNTGGWTMTTDKVDILVEDNLTIAHVYITLTQPSPDEMPTQSLETLASEYNTGETNIDRAELHVKRTVRGATADVPTAYVVEKNTGG